MHERLAANQLNRSNASRKSTSVDKDFHSSSRARWESKSFSIFLSRRRLQNVIFFRSLCRTQERREEGGEWNYEVVVRGRAVIMILSGWDDLHNERVESRFIALPDGALDCLKVQLEASSFLHIFTRHPREEFSNWRLISQIFLEFLWRNWNCNEQRSNIVTGRSKLANFFLGDHSNRIFAKLSPATFRLIKRHKLLAISMSVIECQQEAHLPKKGR